MPRTDRGASSLVRTALSALVLLVVASCAPKSASIPGASGGAGQPGSTAPARGAKVISIGMQLQEEPVGKGPSTGIVNVTGPGSSGGSGSTEHRLMFHAG